MKGFDNFDIVLVENNEITLKELLLKFKDWYKFVLSKWVVIFTIAILGGITGIIYSLLTKPVYHAVLSFALEDDKQVGNLGAATGLASQFGFDLGGGSSGVFSGDNLLELMRSRSMIQKALMSTVNIDGKQRTLASFYIDINNLRDKLNPELRNISFDANLDESKLSLQQDSVLGVIHKSIIKRDLAVDKVDKKLSIITVSFTSPDQRFSKFFCENLVNVVSNFYVTTKTKKASQNASILQHQTDSVRAQLNGAISNVAASIDVNPNANPSRQILRVPSQRRQVEVQANTAILTELVKNLEIAKINLRKETPLIQIIDKPILPLEKTQLSKLKGFVTGAVLAGFLTVLTLSLNRFIKKILK